MIDLFGEPITEPLPAQKPKPEKVVGNPCILVYGTGPDGQTCKGCVHLRYALMRNPNARHWKCDRRVLTHGRGSDHKVSFPACAKYEKRTEEYHGG